MSFTLQAISLVELQIIAAASTPADIAAWAQADALPPPFVAQRALGHHDSTPPDGWCSTFYIVRDADRAIVGSCGFKYLPSNGRVEIGYGISPDCRREGAASAAVAALLALAFEHPEINQVLAQIDPSNHASIGVVRNNHFKDHGLQLDEDGELVMQWLDSKPHRIASNAA